MFYQVWGMNTKNTIEKAVLQLAVLSKEGKSGRSRG